MSSSIVAKIHEIGCNAIANRDNNHCFLQVLFIFNVVYLENQWHMILLLLQIFFTIINFVTTCSELLPVTDFALCCGPKCYQSLFLLFLLFWFFKYYVCVYFACILLSLFLLLFQHVLHIGLLQISKKLKIFHNLTFFYMADEVS